MSALFDDQEVDFAAPQPVAPSLSSGAPFAWLPDALRKAGMQREAEGALFLLRAFNCECETSAFLKRHLLAQQFEAGQPLSAEAKFALIEQHLGLMRRRVAPETVVDPATGRWSSAARYFDLIDAARAAKP